jgi:hypothetical protein
LNSYNLMKTNRYYNVAILMLGLVWMQACEVEGPAGIDGPWVTGTLEGTIIVTDEFGVGIEDKSGFTVKVENTFLSAVTDQDGYWRIDSLHTGTYNITCSKQGFVTSRYIAYSYIGGGTANLNSFFWMSLPSTTEIEDLTLEMQEQDVITIHARIYPLPSREQTRMVRLFLYHTTEVSYDQYLYTGYFVPYYRDIDENGYFTLDISALYLSQDFNLDKINTYYGKAYGISCNDMGYPDINTGLSIYPSLNLEGASNVATLSVFQ